MLQILYKFFPRKSKFRQNYFTHERKFHRADQPLGTASSSEFDSFDLFSSVSQISVWDLRPSSLPNLEQWPTVRLYRKQARIQNFADLICGRFYCV